MKGLLRLLGVLAGLAILLWVMRERFISLALPHEPEPPAFRVAPHPSPALEEPEPTPTDDLTIIKGIGPVYSARLEDAGMDTLALLAAADADELGRAIGVPAGRVRGWMEEAAFLASFRGG